MGKYNGNYHMHLSTHNLLEQMNNLHWMTYAALAERRDLQWMASAALAERREEELCWAENDFDRKLICTLDYNTEENYFRARQILNEHFVSHSPSNTLLYQCPYLSRLQEQYNDAIHYLNRLMMNDQQHVIPKDRIPMLRNDGTNDGSYRRVKYNTEEEEYFNSNKYAVSNYKRYLRGKRDAAATDPNYTKRRLVEVNNVWVRGLGNKADVQLPIILVDNDKITGEDLPESIQEDEKIGH